MYFFTILEDSIILQNIHSSCICRTSYLFNVQKSQDIVRIGNFYNEGHSDGETLVFERF